VPRASTYQVREQDPTEFSSLVERHRPRLRALAFAIVGDREEAEDVVQEALLRGFLALATVRHPDRVGNWLAAITANLARMRRRRPQPEAVSLDLLQTPVPSWLDPAQPEFEAPAEEIRQALAALPTTSRETLLAHYVEGLSCAEIAARVGSSPGAVRVRLHRARGQLRAQLPAFATSSKEAEMIEVALEDVWVRVAPDAPVRLAGEQRIVLLREKGGERVLPIWIGPPEGDALAIQLRGGSSPRPLTPDLTTRLLEAAGACVERVVVTRLEDNTFYAVVAVGTGGEVREVDARPSDALNLALRVGAPVFVDGAVLEQAGLVGDDLPALLDRECERIAEEGVIERPPPGKWQPHSLELTAFRWPPRKAPL
jgi:RNA polymerase sigma factor (sigma-70 family)